ncbi:MAG: hypothetical protein QM737_23875 [Ferruginibacter sp.]
MLEIGTQISLMSRMPASIIAAVAAIDTPERPPEWPAIGPAAR